ncbi:MAG: cytochrome c biogenesis protein CcsA [Acidobacteriota bacterium]
MVNSSPGSSEGPTPLTRAAAMVSVPVSSPSVALVAAAASAMVASLYAALIYAPSDSYQGDVQRLFYLHVPAALTMYVAITMVFLASILYLQRRESRWDEVGAAAAEVGTLFGTIVLITGPIWARPIWGTWWTWDARLTSFFILWLIFVAYLMLRAYGGSPEQVARYCAVLAIIGFLDLPIIHFSVQWWRTLHPQPVLMTEQGLGANLPGSMLIAFAVGLVSTLLLFCVLFLLRLRIERMSRRLLTLRRLLEGARREGSHE